MSKSVSNKDIIQMSFNCGCEEYKDIKTFKAWIKNGRVVKKGEKGTKLHAYIKAEKENEKGVKEEKTIVRPYRATVFCRCQTEELKPKNKKEEKKEKFNFKGFV